MTKRINYRAAQGQQFAGTPGGGFLFDQFRQGFEAVASTVTMPRLLPVGQVPQFDTLDFGSSVMGDYSPISVTPWLRPGRITLALGTSLVSTASNPTFALKRFRAGASATLATWNLTTLNVSAAWTPLDVSGSAISNASLIAGDQLVLVATSNTSGPPPFPAVQIVVDFEG